jgi:hypothetical protein
VAVLGSHVLLGVAVAALAGAGVRLAARCQAGGLAAALAAAAFACALAAAEALLLGLAGVGSSPAALAAAAALTWLAARALLPAPAPPLRSALAGWWARLGPGGRAWAGALAALWLGWVAWQLRYPSLSVDGLVYHLALPGLWVHEGSPGADVEVIAQVPFGHYPLTNEVLTGWALSISRSWVVGSVWSPLLAALLGAAAWTGLRALGLGGRIAGLAVAALLSLPLVVSQLGGPLTDLAALTWLVVCGALCAASATGGGRPLLLAPALVAAGLAFGTKTTPAVLLLLALGAAAWRHRGALRAHAREYALALALAAGAGGVWATRNLLEHGSPLWPFVSGPFGDPVPPRLDEVSASFLDHPGEMLAGRVDDYLLLLAGAAVLIVAALVLPLLRRSRAALAAGGAAGLALVSWMAAPYTGIDESTELAIGATRYLLPAIATAALAAALSARGAGRALRGLVAAALALAVALSVLRVLSLGFPFRPGGGTLVSLLVLGAGAGLLAGRLTGRRSRPLPPAWAAPALCVGAAALLAAAAPGYVERHADVGLVDQGLLRALAAQPGWGEGDAEVAMGPGTIALAAGDRLEHRVPLASADAGCHALRAHRERGWLVLQKEPPTDEYERMDACMAGTEPVWEDDAYALYPPAR